MKFKTEHMQLHSSNVWAMIIQIFVDYARGEKNIADALGGESALTKRFDEAKASVVKNGHDKTNYTDDELDLIASFVLEFTSDDRYEDYVETTLGMPSYTAGYWEAIRDEMIRMYEHRH